MEFCALPLAICFLARLPRHFRLDLHLFRQPLVQLVLLWGAWMAFSLLWSPDPHQGAEELGKLRFAYLIIFLWPVMDRRPLLIRGLIAGFLAANAAQAVHAVGTEFQIESLRFPRMPHRDSGWWKPVVGGSMLTAAVGLHLAPALWGSAFSGAGLQPAFSEAGFERAGPVGQVSNLPVRWLGVLGTLITLTAVFATGSRGAWIASAALVGGAVVWAVVRAGLRRISWGHTPLIAALAVLAAVGAYSLVGNTVRERTEAGIAEVRAALEQGDFTTDTGARLLMAQWAIEAIGEHPFRGVGAGGYHAWAVEHLRAQGIDPAARSIHAHAHNTALHVGATTGVIGLTIVVSIFLLALRGAFTSPRAADDGPAVSGYALGPALALVGLALVSPFDTLEVNAQTSALLFLLIALCIPGRPRPAGGEGGCAADGRTLTAR